MGSNVDGICVQIHNWANGGETQLSRYVCDKDCSGADACDTVWSEIEKRNQTRNEGRVLRNTVSKLYCCCFKRNTPC